MSPADSAIPRKTERGRDEQRSRRSAVLGQRHRTILFLVDGQRSVAEVLRLAEQAGAAASHFDELLRLGLVEVPGQPAAQAPAAAPAAQRPAKRPAAEPPGRAAAEPPAPMPAELPLLDEVAVPKVSGAPLVPVPRPHGAGRPPAIAAPRTQDDRALLDEARAHLLEALRIDPPPFVSRLASRVRGAADAEALTELVLQLEREIGRQRRSPVALAHIEQARELLGLGNTVVAEDSSWHGWPDTL